MAEEKKPTRRTPAAKKSTPRKRTPAKKADTPKAVVEAQEQANKTQELIDKTVAEQESKVAAYNALKEKSLPIPAALKAEVESAQSPEPAVNPQRYVRNMSYTMFRFKLSRHTPQQRGIVLQGRGTRGDLSPIEAEDLNDPILQANLRSGYLELITHAEAQTVVNKQTTNQQAVHPALSALRNEKGEEYAADAVSVGPSPDEQAITVAKLDDGQIAFDRSGIRDRVRGEAPGTPEYVTGSEPNHRPSNEQGEYLSDQRARQRGHNPADGLKVSVAEPVRTGGNPSIISDGFKADK